MPAQAARSTAAKVSPVPQLCSQTPCGVRFAIRVQPRSARTRVVGLIGSAFKVQVTAPPVEGAANEAVVALLAEWLGVPRRTIAIVRGASGRDKVVEVSSTQPAALAARIAALGTAFVDKATGGA